MALSFRECHTKIRHVDAHATLNEGVVVQVMGELSNNMQPMRKFMQTFVLAPEVGSSAFISAPQLIGRVHPLLVSFRGLSQTNSTSTTTCSVTRMRCLLTLTLSLQKVRHPQTLPVSTSFTFLTIFCSVWPSACSFFYPQRWNLKSFCSSVFERLSVLEPKWLRIFFRNASLLLQQPEERVLVSFCCTIHPKRLRFRV